MTTKNLNPKPQVVMYAIVYFLPKDLPFEIVHQDKELQPLMDKALTELDLTKPVYIVHFNEDQTWGVLYIRAGDVWAKYQRKPSGAVPT